LILCAISQHITGKTIMYTQGNITSDIYVKIIL
jgi:hypothetical protein